MRIHFIAIGGAAMHNLAIALHKRGDVVTGSDDQIFEPSKGRLNAYGLLPSVMGWDAQRIDASIDVIILGMHARPDNPELLAAQEQGLKIYSYPEFLYEATKDKMRVVIGGSHGKTSITSMVMHVLKFNEIHFDYMVGAQIDGFDTMVSLSPDARVAVFEGDEYLSSPIDRRPKFHWYKPQVALLSGIAWDHINVFPTLENYEEQFSVFAKSISDYGSLIYYKGDEKLCEIADEEKSRINCHAYDTHVAFVRDNMTYVKYADQDVQIGVFGEHNLQNLEGARLLCREIGLSDAQFYQAIPSFQGAARRLELLAKNDQTDVFRDFAHSPSKLMATTKAVKAQYRNRKLVACMELHTFSSLKKDFLPQYAKTMLAADFAFVYYDEDTIVHKQLEFISKEDVAEAFQQEGLEVFTSSDLLFDKLEAMNWANMNLLLMSSGTFSGKDLPTFAMRIVKG